MLPFRWIGRTIRTWRSLIEVDTANGHWDRPVKGDEWQRCGQGDFLTQLRWKHHIRYLDGDVWTGAGCRDCALCTNSDRLATGCGGSARVQAIALFAASPCPVSLATSLSLISLHGSLSRRLLAVSTSIIDPPSMLQSTTARWVFVRTVRPIHLNGSIRHKALKAADAIPLCLSFQCNKVPPVMTSLQLLPC